MPVACHGTIMREIGTSIALACVPYGRWVGLGSFIRRWWLREDEIAMEIIDGQVWARVGDGDPFLIEHPAPHVLDALSGLESGVHTGTIQQERWPTRLWRRLNRASS